MVRDFLLICIGLFCFSGCRAQTKSDFTDTIPPQQNSKAWFQLNHSEKRFSVSLVNGKLTIGPRMPYQEIHFYKMPHGRLLGINIGEWGGGLYYLPDDTLQKEYTINNKPVKLEKHPNILFFYRKQDGLKDSLKNIPMVSLSILHMQSNIHHLFAWKDTVCIAAGLAHMGENDGEIYALTLQDNAITLTKKVTLKGEPEAIAIKGDNIYVAEFDNFCVIRNWVRQPIFEKIFWWGLGPSSIAVKNEHEIYVGITGGYTRIDAVKKELKFYKYNKL